MGREAQIAVLRQHAEPILDMAQGLRLQSLPNLPSAGRPTMLLSIAVNEAANGALPLCGAVHWAVAVASAHLSGNPALLSPT